jgi:dTDP-4-dehydrorhamnose reductase
MTEAAGELPLPLLITGVTGVAGFNAFHHFRARFPGKVIGARPRNQWRFRFPEAVACDVEDGETLRRLIERHRIRSVLDCAGNCALKDCELDPAMARRLNVEGARTLIQAVAGAGVRLIHLSVDLVFSGASGRGGYVEEDAPDPVTVYGKTMAEAERLFLERMPDCTVLRISLPMGPSFSGHAGAIDWIENRFKQGKPATLYFDEVRTPTYTNCLNALFERLLARPLGGLYHAGGPRRLSLYEIAQIVNRGGGYDPELLIGIPRRDAGPMPPRAGNVALDSTKLARALGSEPFLPWPLDDALAPSHRRWHFERPAGAPYSPEHLARALYRHPQRAEVDLSPHASPLAPARRRC